MKIVTNDMVVRVMRAIWPLWANGDVVEIEPVARAKGCAATASVLWNGDAGRWWVLIDEALSPEKMLFYCAHELGHVALGHSKKNGDGMVLAMQRNVFKHGKASMVIGGAEWRWSYRRTNDEAIEREQAADQWAESFCDKWWPVFQTAEEAGVQAIKSILGRVSNG